MDGAFTSEHLDDLVGPSTCFVCESTALKELLPDVPWLVCTSDKDWRQLSCQLTPQEGFLAPVDGSEGTKNKGGLVGFG